MKGEQQRRVRQNRIGTFINFQGRARETMAFYQKELGGKVKGKIAPQSSGGSTGYLMDPFGINWVVTINNATQCLSQRHPSDTAGEWVSQGTEVAR